MTARTTGQVLELVLKAIPHPHLIREIDLTHTDCINFTWRGIRFHVTVDFYVDEVQEHCWIGTPMAILLNQVLKQAAIIESTRQFESTL